MWLRRCIMMGWKDAVVFRLRRQIEFSQSGILHKHTLAGSLRHHGRFFLSQCDDDISQDAQCVACQARNRIGEGELRVLLPRTCASFLSVSATLFVFSQFFSHPNHGYSRPPLPQRRSLTLIKHPASPLWVLGKLSPFSLPRYLEASSAHLRSRQQEDTDRCTTPGLPPLTLPPHLIWHTFVEDRLKTD